MAHQSGVHQQYFPFFGWNGSSPMRCESPPQAGCRTTPDFEQDSPSARTHYPQPRRIVPLLLEGNGPHSPLVPPTSPDPSACELLELLGLDKTDGQSQSAGESNGRWTTACGDSRPVSALSALSTSVGRSSVSLTSPSPDELARYYFAHSDSYRSHSISPTSTQPSSTRDAWQPPGWPSKLSQWDVEVAAANPTQAPIQYGEPTPCNLSALLAWQNSLPLGLLPPRSSTPLDAQQARLGGQLPRTEPPGPSSPAASAIPSVPLSWAEPPGLERLGTPQSARIPWPEPMYVGDRLGSASSTSLGQALPTGLVPTKPASPSLSEGKSAQQKNPRGPLNKAKATPSAGVGPKDLESDQLTEARVVQLSKTQAGSKLLQRKLLKGHPNIIKQILDGIEVELPTLMCDMYGNYLCSAAFPACSLSQRQRMLELVTSHLQEVATDRWGTYSFQALISLICTKEEQDLLMYSLRDCLVELSCDANGVHAVQRSLLAFGQSFVDVILPEVIQNMCTFANNPHGLGFLKKCISECREDWSRHQLINGMSVHVLDLVQGPFGNYAVQHVLEEWGSEVCQPIIQILSERLVQLSIQKFSSNVVEQLLHCAPHTTQQRLFEELSNPEQIGLLMSTVYGHYVARRALQTAEPGQKATLENALRRGLRQVRNRRLRLRWERALREDGGTGLDMEADDRPISARETQGRRLFADEPPDL